MSKSRQHKNNDQLFENLTQSLNKPFNIQLAKLKHVYITAKNLYRLFEKETQNLGENLLPALRKRSSDKKNILHLLFNWKINKNNLNRATNRTSFASGQQYFTSSYDLHIFLHEEIKEKFHASYPDKKKYSEAELLNVFTQQAKKVDAYYFNSVEEYYSDQLIKIVKTILEILASHPDAITSMLTERDNEGNTPLHYLSNITSTPDTAIEFFKLVIHAIKTLPEQNKHTILFAEDDSRRLFLHLFYKNFHLKENFMADVFDESDFSTALITKDKHDSTPLMSACENQEINILVDIFQLLLKYKHQSVLLQQDNALMSALLHLINNDKLNDEDINKIFSCIDPAILDQIMQQQTKYNHTLLSHAIVANRVNVIKLIPQFFQFNSILKALLLENKSGLHPLHLAFSEANLDTFRLVAHLFSPHPIALCGILATSPLINDAKHFSSQDAIACIKQVVGTLHIFSLSNTLSSLIKTNMTENTKRNTEDFVETCFCIMQGRPVPKAETATFSLFTTPRTYEITKKMKNVTAEHVQWYFNEVLPFIHTFAPAEKQKTIEWILNLFQSRMQSIQSLLPVMTNTNFTLATPELKPVYDAELETRWRKCEMLQRETVERERDLINRIDKLNHPDFINSQQYLDEKNSLSQLTTPDTQTTRGNRPTLFQPPIDVIDNRRRECFKYEDMLTKRLHILEKWESMTARRELLLTNHEPVDNYQMSYQFN